MARTADMAVARSFANRVVLPDGQVFVVGGPGLRRLLSPIPVPGWLRKSGTRRPVNGPCWPRWRSPGRITASPLLLPDGRVFVGGGGLCGTCTTNHLDGEIFTPPYLLNADGSARTRPTIVTAPATAAAGSTICRDHRSARHQVLADADEHGDPHREHRPAADSADATSVSGNTASLKSAGGSRRARAGHLHALRSRRQRSAQRRVDDQDQLMSATQGGARRDPRLLAAEGDDVTSLFRSPVHSGDVAATGATPAVPDVEN